MNQAFAVRHSYPTIACTPEQDSERQPRIPIFKLVRIEMFGEFQMMSFLPASISFRALSAGVAAVGAFLAGRRSLALRPVAPRRYLVIAEGHADKPGPIMQVQLK
jgi:hypothetical protein